MTPRDKSSGEEIHGGTEHEKNAANSEFCDEVSIPEEPGHGTQSRRVREKRGLDGNTIGVGVIRAKKEIPCQECTRDGWETTKRNIP